MINSSKYAASIDEKVASEKTRWKITASDYDTQEPVGYSTEYLFSFSTDSLLFNFEILISSTVAEYRRTHLRSACVLFRSLFFRIAYSIPFKPTNTRLDRIIHRHFYLVVGTCSRTYWCGYEQCSLYMHKFGPRLGFVPYRRSATHIAHEPRTILNSKQFGIFPESFRPIFPSPHFSSRLQIDRILSIKFVGWWEIYSVEWKRSKMYEQRVAIAAKRVPTNNLCVAVVRTQRRNRVALFSFNSTNHTRFTTTTINW